VKIERRALIWLLVYIASSLVLTIFIPVKIFNPVRTPHQFPDNDFLWNLGEHFDGTFLTPDWPRFALRHAVALVGCVLAFRLSTRTKK
jgi:hypothetical protein